MTSRGKIGIGLSVFGLALLLAACGQSSSGTGMQKTGTQTKPLKVTASQAMATADPTKATDVVSQAAIAQVYEGLYTTNQKGKIIPGIATKVVKPTNGGKTYTFTLRKNAK
ncbi:hypothetical protein [Secundilactobacillus paracollinoides]|uniref:hypothetical protein n=1 Tax=Secundilactobacillus paracollinoides TaxID=240427 RepID=UPI000AEC1DFD|nr:hypothetical protein [Secundilactobacillus paracollinoides]